MREDFLERPGHLSIDGGCDGVPFRGQRQIVNPAVRHIRIFLQQIHFDERLNLSAEGGDIRIQRIGDLLHGRLVPAVYFVQNMALDQRNFGAAGRAAIFVQQSEAAGHRL
ncbi:hypothetical protein D1872_304440 [compost metagenome]